jgi:hypothetical protein
MKTIDDLLASSTAESRDGDAGLAALLLGLRALALVLKHEWTKRGHCPECGEESLTFWADENMQPTIETGGKHAPDCEWGRVVAEAKAIG